MDSYQMDPPKLGEHGKNRTNYGSWVLEAIDIEGLTETPHETFAYLENCYGSILRPGNWLAAEETAQSADSHYELENLPRAEEGFLDSPNDCAKTKSGYLTPKTEVVDVQSQVAGSCAANSNEHEGDHTETPTGYLEPEVEIVDLWQVDDNLPATEVGVTDVKRHNECVTTLRAADERSQHVANEVAENQRSPEWISEASEPADDATWYSYEQQDNHKHT
ncbi:hypothetical protein EDC04DRAFT_2612643 [Pisolithus marmoratus]|nr:hypothetical protein EDC04DRAFT_2612643 [Pisolithus marmoratus]